MSSAVRTETWRPRADLRGLALPLALVAAAEIAARATGLESDTLAPPSAVARVLGATLADGSLLAATAQTLGGSLAGLLIGLVAGLALGTLMGLSRLLDRLLSVSVEIARPTPSIALVPIAMMVFGLGLGMEVAVVAFATLWPVLLLTRAAVAGVEPKLIEVARVLDLGPGATVAKVVLPAILPRLFVAFRLAAGIALIVAVTVEVTANPIGLGYALMSAQQSLDPARMLAALVWVGVVGWGLNAGLLHLERRLFAHGRPA